MHTRVFLSIALIGSFILSSIVPTVYAQEAELPQVNVRNLTVDQSDLKAGDTVTGSFVITNAHPKDVPNVMYKISFLGGFNANGEPVEEYDSKTFGPIYLHAQEQNKLVTYSYVLPKAFNKSTATIIRARAYLDSGIPLGWDDEEVTVSGGSTVLTYTGGTVSVDSNFFPLDIGPTVYSTSTSAFVRAAFTNNSSESITVTPKLAVFNRSVTTQPLTTASKETFTLAPKAKGEVVFDLPRFSNKAGVYLGQIQFPDSTGVNRATTLEFQYLIAGDQVIIDAVSADKASVQKNDAIKLKIHYAGAPYDIVTGKNIGTAKADLGIKIFDEHNNVVAEQTSEYDFSQGTEKEVTLSATRDARAMRAEITVVKGSTVLTSYKTPLSGNYDEMSALPSSGNPITANSSSALVAAVLSIVGLGVILGVILYMRSRSKKTLYVLAALILSSGFFMASAHQADAAFVITKSESINCIIDQDTNIYTGPQPHCEPGDFRPQVTAINTPSNQLDPGETFQFTGTVKLRSCLNTPPNAFITVTFEGVTKVIPLYGYNGVDTWSNNHNYPLTSRDFYSSPLSKFKAPTKAGVYRLKFRVDNYTRIGNRHDPQGPNGQTSIRGYTEGYMDITVGNPVVPPTVNLTASPNPVAYNTAATLKWSSTNTTSCTASGAWTGAKAKTGSQSTGNLTAKQTYTINCTGPGGSASDTVTVNVSGQPNPTPTVTFTANPTTIQEGQNTNLSWSSKNATSCTASITSASPDASASNAWNGSTNPSVATGLHSKVIPTLTKNTTFKIVCNGAGGSAEKTATVIVTKKPIDPTSNTPVVTLIADQTKINSGGTVNLTWTPVYTSSCTASASPANANWTNGTESAAPGSHTKTSSPITSNTLFTITCTGDSTTKGETVSDDVTVVVDTGVLTNPPTVVLTANPTSVTPGGSTTLTWTVTNATSCTASATGNIWTGNKSASNGTYSAVVNGIYNATEFTLTCTGQGGVESDTASVTMATATLSCSPSPTTGVRVDDDVTWTANPGNLNIASGNNYSWSGTPELVDGSTGQSIVVKYKTKGEKYATVTATLGDGSKVTKQCTMPVVVGAKPTFIEF